MVQSTLVGKNRDKHGLVVRHTCSMSVLLSTVSFALGVTTIGRRKHTYLKQMLTSILSRMTPEEEKDSVVIVSVADVCMGNEVLSSLSVASKSHYSIMVLCFS